jgi:hypothetical protein
MPSFRPTQGPREPHCCSSGGHWSGGQGRHNSLPLSGIEPLLVLRRPGSTTGQGAVVASSCDRLASSTLRHQNQSPIIPHVGARRGGQKPAGQDVAPISQRDRFQRTVSGGGRSCPPEPRRSRHRPERRGPGLSRSARSRFSSLLGRRPEPVQLPSGLCHISVRKFLAKFVGRGCKAFEPSGSYRSKSLFLMIPLISCRRSTATIRA